jgi:hypothetical protein
MFLPTRRFYVPAILLTAMLAGCRDDPAPQPDPRATRVEPKQDKPTAEKPAPSASFSPKSPIAPVVKPTLEIPAAAPSASAAPSAAAAPEPPAAAPDTPVDCDKLLLPEDVFDACKLKVELPKDQPTEDIGSEPRCSRKFESKDAGLLTLIVLRHSSEDEAKERYAKDFVVDLSKPDVVKGVTGLARFYLKKGVSGDPILTSEAVKGRFNVTLFNPKVTVGGQTVGPVCEQEGLGKLLVKVLERMP